MLIPIGLPVPPGTPMIDLTTLEHEFVTMDELFAKPEIEGDPFVDPSVAFFDANEHLYVAAFQEYTRQKVDKIREERNKRLRQVLRDEKDEDSQASQYTSDSDTETETDSDEEHTDVVRLPKSPGNRKAPKAPPKKPCAPSVYKGEAQEMKLLKEMFKLCSSSGNLSFVLADLKKRPLAEEILRKNKQQYVASLLQKGFISQMEEDYRSGRYTVTNKTRTLAETWY